MTDREKCAELLEQVKAIKGESHDIYYFLKGTYDCREDISYQEFVDELMDEVMSYARGLWC
jgi:hypothetical protein